MINYVKSNKRNSYGVKDSSDTYRTVGGRLFRHWTCWFSIEHCRADQPQSTFIKRGDDVYKLVEDNDYKLAHQEHE